MSKLRLIQVIFSIIGILLTIIGTINYFINDKPITLMIVGILIALSTYIIKLIRFIMKD